MGPGAGKYAALVRQAAPEARLTAVEIDPKYVEAFNLRSLYDEVIVAPASILISKPRVRFDVAIFGDCIEHMYKSSGIDLLNFLIYRCGYIFVVWPEGLIQDDWEGHAWEAHISTWAPWDFAGWQPLHIHTDPMMHLVAIKGYQPTRVILEE